MPQGINSTRKLSAILSADVKGYSFLIADDEIHTIEALKAYRQIISDLISYHSGRIVDSPGDNILAEFRSAVDAVGCAVKIQERLNRENARYVDEKKVQFRIGVNVGDVVQDGDRIYGNGVNVAARIEGLAEPGGVCVSRNAYDHIKNKLKLGYEYLGDHKVKNIDEPVRVYKVLLDSVDAGKLIGLKPKSSAWRWILFSSSVMAIAFFVITWQLLKENSISNSSWENSLAVLPFDNMSNDPEQEYFSDGIAEDLITDLSKIKGLKVISKISSFTYKNKDRKLSEIGKELNVRYILEGSVRKAGDHLRITAQLIEANSDHHIWAERFDGKLVNIFDLQDKITEKIINALSVTLTMREDIIIGGKGTNSIEAYDAFLKGKNHLSLNTASDHLKAINYFNTSINIDPKYSRAYAALGIAYQSGSNLGLLWQMGIDPREARLKAQHYMEIAMTRPTYEAYQLSGSIAMHRRHFNKAIIDFEKSLSLAPNDIYAYVGIGWALIANNEPKAAIKYLDTALQLDPLNLRSLGTVRCLIGMAAFSIEQYERCISSIEQAQSQSIELHRFSCFTAASYAILGHHNKANEALKKFMKNRQLDMQSIYYSWPFNNNSVFERLRNGLILSGFPESISDYYEIKQDSILTANEIKKLILGHTIVGNFWGGEWQKSYGLDSEIILTKFYNNEIGKEWYDETFTDRDELRHVVIKGRYWIDGDMNCWQSDKHFNGLKICENFYRNKEGSANKNTEYIGLDELGIYFFSIID